jgi:hypothetical protein
VAGIFLFAAKIGYLVVVVDSTFLVGLVLVTVFVVPLGFSVVLVFDLVTGVDVCVWLWSADLVAACALAPRVITAAANTRAIDFKLFIFLLF